MPEPKRNFRIETPRGVVVQCQTKTGRVSSQLIFNANCGPKFEKGFSRAQVFVDSECIRRMNPYTPRLSGVLIKSATLGTVVGSGVIEQVTPYARRQYYEHKGKGARGSKWFEVMKKAHKDSIIEGAEKIVENR